MIRLLGQRKYRPNHVSGMHAPVWRRLVMVFAIPLSLAACERREVVSICAATGDPAVEVTAVAHDLDGQQSALIRNTAADRTTVARQTLDAPALPELWRRAEHTIRSLREVDAVPCGLDTMSFVVVTFDDGSTLRRETSCAGNALAILAREIIEATDLEEPAPGDGESISGAQVVTVRDACEILS